MTKKSLPIYYSLASILALDFNEVKVFKNNSFLQVLREQNHQVDMFSNGSVILKEGVLRVNGATKYQTFPYSFVMYPKGSVFILNMSHHLILWNPHMVHGYERTFNPLHHMIIIQLALSFEL